MMSEGRHDPLLIVAGPTASGKSALAVALAETIGGTVINADSMQVYRDLAVLTARPGAAEEARAPHRLYGVIDAAESCSVGRWRDMALVEIAAARAAGRIPILAGGTGLYIEAFVHGLAAVPPVPPAVRHAARDLYDGLGPDGFHAALAARDPEAAAALAPGDTQRILRAYEVVTATGRTLRDWQRAGSTAPVAAPTAAVMLLPPRDQLYRACDTRVRAMIDQGAVDEVRALLAQHLSPSLPAMKAVGVRELGAWLAGACDRATAIAAMQQATRRYAKRQFTWLRHHMADLRRLTLDAQFSESLLPEILSFIRQSLLTAKS